ncbi:hypothetical protein KIPB_004633 [Kipferlia bialata]|uniref:Uncharacterized protein n=1 Tax=Kipferlia bialata TaxID=797122 RepID=A0A9K3CXA4_9EUKA|nr:hypothetical protein KIPB_000443 [Kipferlia bialata]GIQ83329.1 hypothetical protein KIPB_004633 [Kipferlia bialata]|eukprot:g443.t1
MDYNDLGLDPFDQDGFDQDGFDDTYDDYQYDDYSSEDDRLAAQDEEQEEEEEIYTREREMHDLTLDLDMGPVQRFRLYILDFYFLRRFLAFYDLPSIAESLPLATFCDEILPWMRHMARSIDPDAHEGETAYEFEGLFLNIQRLIDDNYATPADFAYDIQRRFMGDPQPTDREEAYYLKYLLLARTPEIAAALLKKEADPETGLTGMEVVCEGILPLLLCAVRSCVADRPRELITRSVRSAIEISALLPSELVSTYTLRRLALPMLERALFSRQGMDEGEAVAHHFGPPPDDTPLSSDAASAMGWGEGTLFALSGTVEDFLQDGVEMRVGPYGLAEFEMLQAYQLRDDIMISACELLGAIGSRLPAADLCSIVLPILGRLATSRPIKDAVLAGSDHVDDPGLSVLLDAPTAESLMLTGRIEKSVFVRREAVSSLALLAANINVVHSNSNSVGDGPVDLGFHAGDTTYLDPATCSLLLPLVTELICKDMSWGIRRVAVGCLPALAGLFPFQDRVELLCPAFLQMLKDPSEWVRLEALKVLGAFLSRVVLDEDRERDDSLHPTLAGPCHVSPIAPGVLGTLAASPVVAQLVEVFASVHPVCEPSYDDVIEDSMSDMSDMDLPDMPAGLELRAEMSHPAGLDPVEGMGEDDADTPPGLDVPPGMDTEPMPYPHITLETAETHVLVTAPLQLSQKQRTSKEVILNAAESFPLVLAVFGHCTKYKALLLPLCKAYLDSPIPTLRAPIAGALGELHDVLPPERLLGIVSACLFDQDSVIRLSTLERLHILVSRSQQVARQIPFTLRSLLFVSNQDMHPSSVGGGTAYQCGSWRLRQSVAEHLDAIVEANLNALHIARDQIIPYLHDTLGPVFVVLLRDPVSAVRKAAAKAVGCLIARLATQHMSPIDSEVPRDCPLAIEGRWEAFVQSQWEGVKGIAGPAPTLAALFNLINALAVHQMGERGRGHAGGVEPDSVEAISGPLCKRVLVRVVHFALLNSSTCAALPLVNVLCQLVSHPSPSVQISAVRCVYSLRLNHKPISRHPSVLHVLDGLQQSESIEVAKFAVDALSVATGEEEEEEEEVVHEEEEGLASEGEGSQSEFGRDRIEGSSDYSDEGSDFMTGEFPG